MKLYNIWQWNIGYLRLHTILSHRGEDVVTLLNSYLRADELVQQVRQMYDEQLRSLENLISTQQRNEKKMKDMLTAVQKMTHEVEATKI